MLHAWITVDACWLSNTNAIILIQIWLLWFLCGLINCWHCSTCRVQYQKGNRNRNFFTSRVSGRGNRIGSVFPSVRLSVFPSVSSSALSRPNRLTYVITLVDITEWHQITTVWPKQLWHICGRCVNAGAFSFRNVITYHVSDRGNRIDPVFLSVRLLAPPWLNHLMTTNSFWVLITHPSEDIN